MRTRSRSRFIVAVLSLSSVALIAPQARAVITPPDFTLGPSTLTVGVESDSSADGGCMNGTSNDGCDSFSFKVPLTVDPNNDIGDDLQLPGGDIGIGVDTAQFCGIGNPIFGAIIPRSSLKIKKTKGEDTVSFNGMAEAQVGSQVAMVPVKVLIQVHRHTGKGFFMASGLGDLTLLHGGSSAFVGLSLGLNDGDGDIEYGCTSMTQKNKSQN